MILPPPASASRNSRITRLSNRTSPLSSTSAGILPSGFWPRSESAASDVSAVTISMRSESPSTAAAILTFRTKGEDGEERKIIMAVFPVRDETGPNGPCCRNRRGDHIKRAFHNRPGASAGFARFPVPSTAQASERVVIIGSGPAGYTAAIYAARAMLRPLLLSGFEPGGQLMITTDVENYPGFADPIQGPWLMEQMRAQAEHVGARLESEHVVALDLSRRPFRIQCDSGRIVFAEALILATGAKAKWLGIPSEEALKGFGVSACATCDGFFFRGKNVIVVGGGNSAVEEALYLSQIASHVTVVHRRDTFRAERILVDRLAARPNVAFKWNRTVEEILGRRDAARRDRRAAARRRYAGRAKRSPPTACSSRSAMRPRANWCAGSSR